ARAGGGDHFGDAELVARKGAMPAGGFARGHGARREAAVAATLGEPPYHAVDAAFVERIRPCAGAETRTSRQQGLLVIRHGFCPGPLRIAVRMPASPRGRTNGSTSPH